MKRLIAVILAVMVALSLSTGVLAADHQYEVTATSDNIVIDGVVEDGEWGEAVFSTTPAGALALQPTGWDYWSFTPAPAGQKVEFYITNDADYIYCAGKMIGADKADCPSADVLWQYPHMVVTFGTYEKGTVCPKIEFQGDFYELYTCYSVGFVAGEPFNVCTSQGIAVTDASLLTREDFNVSYDAATRTYHYEMRIPLGLTTLDIWNSDTICLGLDFTDAPKNGQPGNRYLISQAGEKGMGWFGPNNFYFQTSNPLIIKLQDIASLRGTEFTPTKLVERQDVEPLAPDYYDNYELMSVTAICAAVAALFAAAAAIVAVIKKEK